MHTPLCEGLPCRGHVLAVPAPGGVELEVPVSRCGPRGCLGQMLEVRIGEDPHGRGLAIAVIVMRLHCLKGSREFWPG